MLSKAKDNLEDCKLAAGVKYHNESFYLTKEDFNTLNSEPSKKLIEFYINLMKSILNKENEGKIDIIFKVVDVTYEKNTKKAQKPKYMLTVSSFVETMFNCLILHM